MKDYADKIDYKAQMKDECKYMIPVLIVTGIAWAIAFVYAI